MTEKRIAKHFTKRLVNVESAGGLDAFAVTLVIGESQFAICAPTLAELEFAWKALERSQNARWPAMDPKRIQQVCMVEQFTAVTVQS